MPFGYIKKWSTKIDDIVWANIYSDRLISKFTFPCTDGLMASWNDRRLKRLNINEIVVKLTGITEKGNLKIGHRESTSCWSWAQLYEPEMLDEKHKLRNLKSHKSPLYLLLNGTIILWTVHLSIIKPNQGRVNNNVLKPYVHSKIFCKNSVQPMCKAWYNIYRFCVVYFISG